jgi:predicted LPLAT superfamily acyltransferase
MANWQGKSRGGLLGYMFFVFIIKKLGITFAYFFLRFVALYFLFFSSKQKKAISGFYKKGLNYSTVKTFFAVYRNYCTLGEVLVDKIAVLSGMKHKYSFNFDGEENLHKLANGKTGGILINAHVGNWEIAGQLLERIEVGINLLMFDGEVAAIKKYMSDVLVNKNVKIIPIKPDMTHVEQIHSALRKGELIVIGGDRFMPGNKVIECDFLGFKADFPAGPFYLAGKFSAPIIYAFAMKEGKRHYHFYATEPKIMDGFNNVGKRQQLLEAFAQEFADSIELMVRKYPLQWFNYYNFWKE